MFQTLSLSVQKCCVQASTRLDFRVGVFTVLFMLRRFASLILAFNLIFDPAFFTCVVDPLPCQHLSARLEFRLMFLTVPWPVYLLNISSFDDSTNINLEPKLCPDFRAAVSVPMKCSERL